MTSMQTLSASCALLSLSVAACVDDPVEGDVDTALAGGPTYVASRLATAPTIDGALGELAALPAIELTAPSTSAVVRAGWDAQALYVGFDVTDATLLPATGTENKLWNGDGVELMIDAGLDGSATADQNDFHFIVTSSGLFADSRAWTDYAYASGATFKAVTRSGGYRVEVKLPWSALGVAAVADLQLGFDVAFNDRDTTGGTLVSKDFAGLAAFNNPAGWGVLVLGAPPVTTPPTTYGTAYYVRTDGGDATQCTGKADAAYPGSGTNKACAWKHPSIALPSSGSARIAGSDTLYIGSGTYQVGSGGYLQPVPSGATATTRTRILGTGPTPPKLVGVGGTHRVLNLAGSNHVEVGNLEITDGSDCVYEHSNATAKCASGAAWARGGIYAFGSRNVWLHDLDIHGLAARGIHAGGLTDWTIERVKINRNGRAGFEGTSDPGSSNSGKIVMRHIEVGWNGCGERVATGEAWACWAQQTNGYGDGLGTSETAGEWLIEDAYFHHNTSDGLDLRYMDGASTTRATLRRIRAVANAGNQVKLKGNGVIENSVLVGECSYFEGRDFMIDGDHCRAYGSTLLLVLTGNDTVVVRHNTLAGEGDVQIGYAEGGSTDKVEIRNNVVVGFPYYFSPSVQTVFGGGNSAIVRTYTGNLAWNVRSCPAGNTCAVNPKLTNMTLASFDGAPLAGSPVIDAAPAITGVVDDFLARPRPVGAGPDIGAYEVQ